MENYYKDQVGSLLLGYILNVLTPDHPFKRLLNSKSPHINSELIAIQVRLTDPIFKNEI